MFLNQIITRIKVFTLNVKNNINWFLLLTTLLHLSSRDFSVSFMKRYY